MRRFPLSVSLTAVLLWSSTLAAEDLKPETIRRGKRATALVVQGKGFGSAFCIDPAGFFITNQHVVGKSDTVRLVLNTAEADEKTFEAEVVRSDKTADLALLRIKDAEKHQFTALEIGGVDELIETQQLVAFGYPFGTALAVKEKKYPSISVNVGRVTALRKTKGKLQRIQLDAQLNPGNSGGPVLNSAGKVVGIVRSGVLRSGVNFAIPATLLDSFLAKPELTVASPTVPFKDRHEPLELTIRAARFSKAGPQLDVEVAVGNAKAIAPFVAARTEDAETYRVSIVPVPRPKAGVLLPIAITFSGGSVRCQTPDGDVVLDGKKYRLSNISRIERNDKANVVVLKDGKQISGKKLSVGKLQADFGGYILPLDADRASTIVIYRVKPESDKIAFRVVAKQDGKVVATASGVISLKRSAAEIAKAANAAARPEVKLPGGIYQPPKGASSFEDGAAKVIYQMPHAYTRYTIAGRGRYFVFHLKEDKKLLIMDVLTGKTAAEIPGVMDDALIAGSAEKLVIVLPGQKLMQRWSLKTFKREKVAQLPGLGTTLRALMGANSRGPLFLGAEQATLVDLETLKPLDVTKQLHVGPKSAVRMSYDGRTIAAIYTGGGGSYSLMRLRGNTITTGKFGFTGNAVRWAWPTADGSLITMPGGGLYDANLNLLSAKWLSGSTLFPTVDPRYFISVRYAADKTRGYVTHAAICTTADRRIVHTYVGMEEMAPHGNTNSRNGISRSLHWGSTHFHYIPWANVLISMPLDKKQIVLRRFDLMKSLEATGIDYLFVDSVPPTEAIKGRALSYQIAVKSKRGGLKYKLESGPKGMSVSSSGLLTWNVPPDLVEKTAQAIITVADASGQDIFHSIQMAVRE